MKEYIGTKVIQARAMTRGAYNEYRGWPIPADENPDDEGYLVRYADGYESWSPKDVFEAAYRETAGMSTIDRILAGDKDALVNEICAIVEWARELNGEAWNDITHDKDGGLQGVIRRMVDTTQASGCYHAIFDKAHDEWDAEMRETNFRAGEKLTCKAQRLFDEAYERGEIAEKVTVSRLDTPCGHLIVHLEWGGVNGFYCELKYECSKKDCPHADECVSGNGPDDCLISRIRQMI